MIKSASVKVVGSITYIRGPGRWPLTWASSNRQVDSGTDWSQQELVKLSQPPGPWSGKTWRNMEKHGECSFGQIPIEIVRSPGFLKGEFITLLEPKKLSLNYWGGLKDFASAAPYPKVTQHKFELAGGASLIGEKESNELVPT